MDKIPVHVAGFPRSGSSYTCWLLGDVLDSPIDRWGAALPLSYEGQNRQGNYVIYQMHLQVRHNANCTIAIPDPRTFCPEAWKGERIIYIQRDPRDVLVSAMYYWELFSLDHTIYCAWRGVTPFQANYKDFVTGWQECESPIARLNYEVLLRYPLQSVMNLLERLGIPPVPNPKIIEAIERQSIENKRAQVQMDGDSRPYGKAIQLKHLRKGIAGDWRNHFTKWNAQYFMECFGDIITSLGYEENEDWWKDLPD